MSLLAVCIPATALWIASVVADRHDATLRLDLACEADQCTASVDAGQPLTVEVPGGRWARKLGFYVYNSWDREQQSYFRNLRIERTGTGLAPYELSLTELDHAGYMDNQGDEAWRLREGLGLTHLGAPGQRAVALFAPPTENDFHLRVDLVDTLDAGIAFRGYDEENLWLFVVRPGYNDAFFCRLHRGQVGEIVALMPLRELHPAREALRLGGLVGQILLAAAALITILRLIFFACAQFAPALPARRFSVRPRWVRVTAVFLFAATILICGTIAATWLQGIPHLVDEVAYLFQARVFASGHLWAQAPAHPQFFGNEHLILQGERWFSKYPPLFSALLAIGVLLGAVGWVNPVLAALTGYVVYRLGRELAGPVWGLIAWTLLLVSPFFLIMGANLMSHTLAALLAVCFLFCLIRAQRGATARWWLAAGACLSLEILARPFTAFLLALAVAPLLLVHALRHWDRRTCARAAIALLGGVIPGIASMLLWGALHADPQHPTLNLYAQNNASDTLGFGPHKGETWLKTWGSTGHTPAKALRSTHQYLDSTSDYLFGWPARLSFALMLAALWLHRRRADAWLLFTPALALVGGHAFYWATQHLAYGARYWFAAVPALALLSALGLRALLESAPVAAHRWGQAVLATVLLAMVGWNVTQYTPQRLRELPQFGGITANLAAAAERHELEHALVFVRAPSELLNDGFHLNAPMDSDATIFAFDLGDQNAALQEQYADRAAWLWDGLRLVAMEPTAELAP